MAIASFYRNCEDACRWELQCVRTQTPSLARQSVEICWYVGPRPPEVVQRAACRDHAWLYADGTSMDVPSFQGRHMYMKGEASGFTPGAYDERIAVASPIPPLLSAQTRGPSPGSQEQSRPSWRVVQDRRQTLGTNRAANFLICGMRAREECTPEASPVSWTRLHGFQSISFIFSPSRPCGKPPGPGQKRHLLRNWTS